jgi:hypothetical protein
VAAAAIAIFGAGCSSGTTTSNVAVGSHPLIEESNTGVTFTDDFNPFDQSATAHNMNLKSIIYEPL